MKTLKNSLYFVLGCIVLLSLNSCEPRDPKEEELFTQHDADDWKEIIDGDNPDGYEEYTLNDFLDKFMTEEGNFHSDSTPYRTRSTSGNGFYLYSIDTLPSGGKGIYIRGRISTDDYSGNFYKSMVIQQIVNGEQQNLRISTDLGSSGGMFQMGQEILIRCNGFAVGRYSNQPQLCVPSYNNNIYAMNNSQKVGWAAGRIPAGRFRAAVRFLGSPDPGKLKYDTISLKKLFEELPKKPGINATDMDRIRKADGRLVTIRNVHFTGQANDDGTLTDCVYAHPDSSSTANVFAPSTKNIGYPQSRVLADPNNNTICFSSSEYAKFAYYYLPGADSTGVKKCKDWVGTVSGILGWYQDKASELSKLTGYEWSITPRGIPGIGVADIHMFNERTGEEWIPEEFDPKSYHK